ncbi:MAG: ComEC/Rec2 family competence protein [Coriobacteriia bacterium]|nr:ComEC/Rec2 family competence protein [Coriobacteriia bacterium]
MNVAARLRGGIFALIIAGLALCLPGASAHAAMTVTAIDCGQGDATLIKSNGHAMLVDSGDASQARSVVRYLKKAGVKTLDYYVATHPDADHIGGSVAVYKNFKVKRTLYSPKSSTTRTYKRFLRYMRAEGCSYSHPRAGATYKLGSAKVTVLFGGSKHGDSNDGSLVLRAVSGKVSALLMADASTEVESKLMRSGRTLRSTILKVGHHGSSYSTSSSFLKRVRPKYALVSVGRNSYGHPTSTVLKRLKRAGVKWYRTDRSGSVKLVVSAGKVSTRAKASTSTAGGGSSSSGSSASSGSGSTASSGTAVYLTRTGTKYHRSWCSCLRYSKIKTTLRSARSRGFDPCKLCF